MLSKAQTAHQVASTARTTLRLNTVLGNGNKKQETTWSFLQVKAKVIRQDGRRRHIQHSQPLIPAPPDRYRYEELGPAMWRNDLILDIMPTQKMARITTKRSVSPFKAYLFGPVSKIFKELYPVIGLNPTNVIQTYSHKDRPPRVSNTGQ